MNYCIIPKNNFNIKLNISLSNDNISPHVSNSLIFYLNDVYTQLIKLQDITEENVTIDYINKIVNPFEFIHTNVPGSLISVSKVKPDGNIFFELMEIFQIFNINDLLSLKHKINIAHFTPNHSSTNYLLNMLREDNDDNIICEDFDYSNLLNSFVTTPNETKLDLIICEFNEKDYSDVNNYIQNVILVLLIIIQNQANEGTCIIKVSDIFYKPIIDVLFILSAIYDKMYLVKPSISNITTGERFIICKSLNQNKIIQSNLRNNICPLIMNRGLCVKSIISTEIPYYFLTKIEESNAIIGQQQLEALDQIINIFKNKNRDEKIEHLKRNHIQKCIQWCEKNQLPHNKFIDKVNIFLLTKKKENENIENSVNV